MSYAEPRYPDDYEIISGRDIHLSSFIGRSTAAAAVDLSEEERTTDPDVLRQRKRVSDSKRRTEAKARHAAEIAADPSKQRLCACSCGLPLNAPHYAGGRPSKFLPGHNKRIRPRRAYSQGSFLEAVA